MDHVYDTGKWVVENLPFLAKRKALEREQKCKYCNRYGEIKSMIRFDNCDVPQVFTGYYHPKCAEHFLEENQKTCINCGSQFFTTYRGGENELCEKCSAWTVEYRRVTYENKRAKNIGEPATLTWKEWIKTLADFNWRCAYCGGRYTVMEHFFPVGKGVGTTRCNCVPACWSCNSRKSNKDPFEVNIENAQEVMSYLRSRG